MRNLRLVLVVASTLAVLACGGGAGTPAPTAQKASGGAAGGSAGGAGDGDDGTGGSTGNGGTGVTSDGGVAAGDDDDGAAGETSVCAPLIGSWVATIDPGAVATGTDTALLGGNVAVGGTISYTLTHDDADLPDIVDFRGTAAITAAGQTFNETLQPAVSADSGDPKDIECAAGLHLHGTVNVQGSGDILFAVDGTLDPSGNTGSGTFSMKSADDDGTSLTASGGIHIVRQ